MSNTEGIMYVVAHPTTTPLDKDNRIYTMRNALPYWAKGERLRHRTERRVQLLHQMKLIKIQKLIMIRNMDVVSVRAVRRTIISMKSGGKREKRFARSFQPR